MGRYIVKRLGQAVIVLLGVTLFVFIMLNLTGDPTDFMLEPGASPEAIAALREKLGLDQPLLVRYWIFLKGVVRLDFGDSYYYGEPALDLILEHLPATMLLASVSLGLAVLWSIPAGILSAVKRNSPCDTVIRFISFVGQAFPTFWMGLLLMLVLAVQMKVLPTYGYGSWKHLVMPCIALSTHAASSITRLMRSSMLDVLNKEYIIAAKAKGLGSFSLIGKHALKNSISSVITIVGMQFATMMGGSIVIENVFSYPGVGKLLVRSITTRDFAVVEAGVFIIALFFVGINLLIDISYALINPRVRYD